MSYFQEDSPQFRNFLHSSEDTIAELSDIFKDWCEKANTANLKGEEYCLALKSLYSSIDLHSQSASLNTYKPFLQEISEILSTVLACNEGIVYSLQQVFTLWVIIREFNNFITNTTVEVEKQKKNYEKLLKELETLKSYTLTFKRNYVILI